MEENQNDQFKQEIERLLNESQGKLSEITAISDNAKQKEQDLNTYHNRIIELKASAESNQTSLSETLNSALALKQQLDSMLKETSEAVRSEIKISAESNQTTLQNILNEANALKQQLDELLKQTNETIQNDLKTSAESNQIALSAVLNEGTSLKQQLDAIITESSAINTDIKTKHEESINKVNEISSYHATFQELVQKIDNPDSGIASIYSRSNDTYGQILKANEEASKTKDEITTNKIKSDNLLTESEKLKQNITDNLTKSEQLRTDIGKILDIVRDTGLANSFDRRRKRSEKSLYIWGGVIISGIALSAYLIHQVFISESGQKLFDSFTNDYIKFLLRLTLTSPGVFLAWFGASQFSKERYFLEQYEFKTAAALALENYTQLLKQNHSDKGEDIFKLNIELIKSVYKEPEYIKPKRAYKIFIPKTSKPAPPQE